ncbi:MAG: hypothetical protein U0794_09395 [Isosphaeraceae bacterium]
MGPVAAAIFHQKIGSLLVLLNAVRLLGFERLGPPRPPSDWPGIASMPAAAVIRRRGSTGSGIADAG